MLLVMSTSQFESSAVEDGKTRAEATLATLGGFKKQFIYIILLLFLLNILYFSNFIVFFLELCAIVSIVLEKAA